MVVARDGDPAVHVDIRMIDQQLGSGMLRMLVLQNSERLTPLMGHRRAGGDAAHRKDSASL